MKQLRRKALCTMPYSAYRCCLSSAVIYYSKNYAVFLRYVTDRIYDSVKSLQIRLANSSPKLSLGNMPYKKIDENMCLEFLDSFDYVLTDCDGVLWTGNVAIPGSPETINALVEKGKTVIFVTNNSTKSRVDYIKKCKLLGFNVNVDNIFPTSSCVAEYLNSLGFQKKVYVIGSSGITQEFDKLNITYLPIGPDPLSRELALWLQNDLHLDSEVGAVVVGFDEHISYPKLTKCATYLKNPECLFIATNLDERFPTEGEAIIPGTGTLVAAVETVSCRNATVMGKPHKYLFESVKRRYPQLDASRSIMIGDKLTTDILFGKNNNMKTVLVLTGVTSFDELEKCKLPSSSNLCPDYYLNSLGDLGRLMGVF